MKMFKWIADLFARPGAPAEPLPVITIPGIFTVCQRLGLPKSWSNDLADRRILVAMSSGRTAVFRYLRCKPHDKVDWSTHVFEFERYLTEGERSDFPVYSSHSA